MTALKRIIPCLLLMQALGGCTHLKETVFGTEFQPQVLTGAVLGSTARADLLKALGEPEAIDQRQCENQRSEVYFYQQRYPDKQANHSIAYRTLAVEFKQGVLNGYVLEEQGEAAFGEVDAALRNQLVKGRTTRQQSADILGMPTAKAVLPTALTLPALSRQSTGLVLPLIPLPEGSKEVWQYQHPRVDERQQKTAQTILSLFFDAQGLYLGSVLTHELALQTD